MLIVAPQKQRDVPDVVCVGSFAPASHIAYFQAVNACASRHA
jgi:hypothetical protein